MKWQNGWSVAANFDGELSRMTANYAGKCSIEYACLLVAPMADLRETYRAELGSDRNEIVAVD